MSMAECKTVSAKTLKAMQAQGPAKYCGSCKLIACLNSMILTNYCQSSRTCKYFICQSTPSIARPAWGRGPANFVETGKTAATPLLTHQSYYSLGLSHQYTRPTNKAIAQPVYLITVTSHGRHGASNHLQLDCSFNRVLRQTTRKIPKLSIRVTTVLRFMTGGFPSQRASNAVVVGCNIYT